MSLSGGGVVRCRETDRGTWWLVAQRDFWYRLRDKGFVISSGITLAVLTGLILLRAYGGSGAPTFDLGLLRAPVRTTGRWSCRPVTGRARRPNAAGRGSCRRRGRARGWFGGRGVGRRENLLANERGAERAGDRRADRRGRRRDPDHAGGERRPPRRSTQILTPTPVPVETLEPQDPNRETNSTVAFIAVVILYGQLFGYGVWVATGVIEEKASRVVEIPAGHDPRAAAARGQDPGDRHARDAPAHRDRGVQHRSWRR